MCGILGIAGKTRDWIPKDVFRSSLDVMTHRGPDDRGVYHGRNVSLGHRRLAIIDLTPSGHQPMIDAESGIVVVFNGEIYNYLELRAELQAKGHTFRTASDTEVLLKCYCEWGSDCLGRLNGMWALAIWNPGEEKLFFARDRFGVKPFYYSYGERQGFAFSSEPKALASLFPQFRRVNERSLYEFLSLGVLYTSGMSFYEGIKVLPPAHCGEYRVGADKLSIRRYWNYPEYAVKNQSVSDDVEEFKALLDSSVSIRLRSDVPVGITLSGGPDSTAVLAGAHKAGADRITCFTSVYGGTRRGEAGWAKIACEPYEDDLREIEAPKEDWVETLSRISWHMDGPGYSPAVYPLWYIMKSAREDGTLVLLEGQGADEALGGYPQYGVLSLLAKLQGAFLAGSLDEWRGCRDTWRQLVDTFTKKWVLLWLIREMAPWLININRCFVSAGSTFRDEFVVGMKMAGDGSDERYRHPDRVTRRLHQDHALNILPGLLHYGDTVSMAHSVESRLPFMDYRLVDFLFARTHEIKITLGVTKWVLREYLKSSNQVAIANRKDKLGYPTPVEEWLAADNGAIARDILLASGASIHRFCDPRKIDSLINKFVNGKHGVGNHIYRLLSTELWMQQCLVSSK